MIISQVAKRYKDFKFLWKNMTKIGSFVVFLYILSFYFSPHDFVTYFPVKEVSIIGANHTDHAEMQQILEPLVTQSFFVIDVKKIQKSLHQFPWVAEAFVRRVWPAQIIIELIEKESIAEWNEVGLLSNEGEIFLPPKSTYPKDLPLFMGNLGSEIQMLNYYDIINSLLIPLHLKIIRLELDSLHAWYVTLSNGIKLKLGYKDILTHINHFVKVYPKIVGNRAAEVEYIDLRYSNGMALRWKT